MALRSRVTSTCSRYLDLIDATLRNALANRPPPPRDGPLTMELALPAIARRLGIVDANDPTFTQQATRFALASGSDAVLDGAGQTRNAYWPLLFRAWAPVLSGAERIKEYAAFWLMRTQAFASGRVPISASEGARVGAHLLGALALQTPDGTFASAAHAAFALVVAAQADDGRFLRATSTDQLEAAWYHELAVLHAVDLYARRTGDVVASEAVRRSARYHAAEVQPDHASSHPFALAALLDDDEGIHLADMMLHAAGVQQPATMDAVSLVLLFDALDCGRRIEPA